MSYKKNHSGMNDIFNTFRVVGEAISRINANNTHSGNLSMRDPAERDLFYITATGAQCGALVLQDIVPIRFSGVSWGDARGSTESIIHRKILSLSGSNAVIHAHYLNSTFISFDTKETQLFLQYLGDDEKGREEYRFHPVDLIGSHAIGEVPVGSYFQPVGSAEMEERIPNYLKTCKLTVVRGHGPFVRGSSLLDALHRLSVLDISSKLSIYLRRRGIDVVGIQRKIHNEGKRNFFPVKPHALNEKELSVREIDDATIIEDFYQRITYNYNNSLGAYGTGSISQKISAGEMIYCPMSALPEGFTFPLFHLKIDHDDSDLFDLRLHKLIYQHTHQNTCMITLSPMAVAEGMATLAEQYGQEILFGKKLDIPYTKNDHPVIRPIDAEAIYLNPKLGLVDLYQLTNTTAANPILNMLRWYKGCCIIAGYGVISTGETTLEQAAHNTASAERIAQFRAEVFINEKLLGGPPVYTFEPR